MSERCTRCGNPNDIFNYCPAGTGGEPCTGAAQGETRIAMQRIVDGLMSLEKAIREMREAFQDDRTRHYDNCVMIVERLLRQKRVGLSERSTSADLRAIIDDVEGMFGAPGDWGYETPVGSALRTIYGC